MGGLCRAATSRRGIEVSHASVTWVGNLALILGSKSNLSFTPEGTKFRSEGSNDFKYFFCVTLQLLSYSACSHLKDQMRYEFGSNLQSKMCAFNMFLILRTRHLRNCPTLRRQSENLYMLARLPESLEGAKSNLEFSLVGIRGGLGCVSHGPRIPC